MDKHIRLIGRLICEDAAEADLVRSLLPEHVRLTREEEGCLQFDVTELPGTTIWEVEELFADKAAFDRHQERVRGSDWGRQTGHIRRSYEVDEVDPDTSDRA
ncbi:putative quinol monooxygenase [Wenxinia saemankumensis]|uniref:Quinol monooxygenase YgiN n=1 Tax=Wenxinia saemankumensis TaxID=1447782 RepID=A0A1M6HHV5_9RHOB|nr:antibiotic biosynthesis monooxygenase [Wenxinia saemankumensis]SHJ21742.1 Quinol monooxygenase YgiN [Wenxinia saemankumensis]